MPRASKGGPGRDERHRTSVVVALIAAVSVVLAAILPKLIDRTPPQTQGAPAQSSASLQSHRSASVPGTAAADSTDFERYAIAVWQTLDTVPPLRRDEIAKALFVGRNVEWAGLVNSIAPNKKGIVVSVARRAGYSALFAAIVDSSQLSIASAMRIGDSVVIKGRIKEVGRDLWLERAAIVAHVRR
jgi:hypothetical protein